MFNAPVAYAQFGFGGNQQSEVQAQFSEKIADLNYADDGQAYHTLDVYIPKGEKPANGWPVIVHIYGSAWFSNNSKGMADINTICAAMLDAGYAVVCPNHRSSGDAKYPAQINDIKAVVRWIRGNAKQYNFDTSFIGTSGFSSGAHLASLCAATNGVKVAELNDAKYDIEGNLGKFTKESSLVNACCEWSGPIDLMNMDCDGVPKTGMKPEDAVMGFAYPGHEAAYMLLSPTYFLNEKNVPLMIFHGSQDNVVPQCQGKELYDKGVAAGMKAVFYNPVDGGGHGFNMYSKENLKKMTDFFNESRTGSSASTCDKKDGECCGKGDGACCGKSLVVEDGGTGAYKAIMCEMPGLEAHTVFMPQDLSKFDKKNPLPVLVWGNGACTNSPWEHFKFLNEIASQGYLVIATGYIPMEEKPFEGDRSTPEQQVQSIDWAFAQNKDKNSPLYGKINTKAVCAAGMSCGGLQTLFNCADKRITTYMICNSGLFINPAGAMPGMPMPSKDKLRQIHGPIMYLLGGETDIAYQNGMDDFKRIKHVPAVAVNFPVGHGGTYRQPHGGEFRYPAIAWLNWQLKGDKEASKMFRGNNPELLKRDDWTLQKNALLDK